MRQTKTLLSFIAVMLIAACTDNSLTNTYSAAAGTYQLTVYDGRQPPASYPIQPGDPNYSQYAPNGGTLVVRDGNIQLQSNGTFTEVNDLEITPTGGSTQTLVFSRFGNWTTNGTDLALNIPVQSGYSQPIEDFGTLTVDANGRYTIDYQEDDGTNTGHFLSFEYKRP